MKKQSIDTMLVSFGNWMAKKAVAAEKWNRAYPEETQRDHCVSYSDLADWKFLTGNDPLRLLPSRFQIGDSVELEFYGNGRIKNCKVIKVHFTESKVLYDVSVNHPAEDNYTRLYNIDSVFIDSIGRGEDSLVEAEEYTYSK